MIEEIGKEPKIYFNYQRSYDLAAAAERKLKADGNEIVKLYKYSRIYWVVEYKLPGLRITKICDCCGDIFHSLQTDSFRYCANCKDNIECEYCPQCKECISNKVHDVCPMDPQEETMKYESA